MSQLIRKTMLAGMAAMGLSACGGDATGPDADTLAGEYILFTIDGDVVVILHIRHGRRRHLGEPH